MLSCSWVHWESVVESEQQNLLQLPSLDWIGASLLRQTQPASRMKASINNADPLGLLGYGAMYQDIVDI
jgi:hypothetical protein